jgi:exosortase/archaeosortase family protein
LRHLWLLLASLCAASQISVVVTSQTGVAALLIGLLVWSGAWLCLEEQWPHLQHQPSWGSLVMGSGLVVSGLWRLSRIIHLDAAILILPLWLGLGLALLCRPIRELKPWASSLMVLALPPFAHLFEQALPQPIFAALTGRLCQLLLLLMGVDAASSANTLRLAGGGVEIVSECTGVVLITQMLVMALILLLAFPMPGIRRQAVICIAAGSIALTVNVCRITLLALINASNWPHRQWWFDLFHKDAGSWLFAGIAAALLGWFYLQVMQAALRRQRNG